MIKIILFLMLASKCGMLNNGWFMFLIILEGFVVAFKYMIILLMLGSASNGR